MTDPTFGEIWWVRFDPTIGSEANKTRPAVVLSIAEFDGLRTRVVVPLTFWAARFGVQVNKVRIGPSEQNGLELVSAADVLQVRAVSVRRFDERLGILEAEHLEQIQDALLVVVGASSRP